MKLEVKNLIYRHHLNNNFCLGPLNIMSNNYLRVIGSNGSGKTTFLKCVAGIFKVQSGQASIDSVLIDRIVWVGSEAAIYWDSLLAYEYIILQASLYGIPKLKAQEELKKIKLDYKNQSIFSLSTGQKKIISIVAAIISDCPLVILDEPDSNLDNTNREFIYKLIKTKSSLNKQFFIFSSHIHSSHFADENTIELNKGSLSC